MYPQLIQHFWNTADCIWPLTSASGARAAKPSSSHGGGRNKWSAWQHSPDIVLLAWSDDLVSKKTRQLLQSNPIVLSRSVPLFLPLSPLQVGVAERGASEAYSPFTRRGRVTELRHRPRKWLVGDPVWVKSCPRGGADQRNSGSVTRPGRAMCACPALDKEG